MKIIHTADLHLESKMGVNLDNDKAKKRRNELLFTFENLVLEAKKMDVKVIIIAGDMFDTKSINKKTKEYILNLFKKNSDIDFIYTSGNHDENNFFFSEEELPSNFKTFGNVWKTYSYDDVDITGINYNEHTSKSLYDTLSLVMNKNNIVVLHGQVSQYKADGCINLNELVDKGIDYLALGHIHSLKYDKLDQRGVWVYPGCLEPRGFDELGIKGFVLIDTDTIHKPDFIPFSKRTCHEINVDITGLNEWMDINNKVFDLIRDISHEDLLYINLVGKYDISLIKRIEVLKDRLDQLFFAVRIKDLSKLAINISDYESDISLKSEFIQTVLKNDELDEETKQIVLDLGIKALLGDDLHEIN